MRPARRVLCCLFVLAVFSAGGPVGVLYVCGPYWFARHLLARP